MAIKERHVVSHSSYSTVLPIKLDGEFQDEESSTATMHIGNCWSVFIELFGECRLIQRWLDEKPLWSLWLPLKLLDAILRSFSQVVFANNTISGLFVLIGLGVADGTVCAAGLLAATLATLTALLFNQPWSLIGNGLTGYNGVLVGTVTASLCPAIVEATHGPNYLSWFLIAFGGIMSALITSALMNLCKGASLPAMTVPFNLVGLIIFICLPAAMTHLASTPDGYHAVIHHVEESATQQYINGTDPHVDWAMVLRGSFLSMGQVYAVESLICSAIMYIGIVFYSPMLAIAIFFGSLLSSICGLGLTDKYQAVYSGLWGYNAALTAGAVAVTFYIPTLLSVFNAFLAIIFTAASQRAFSLVLAPAGLPVFTIPFVTTGALFLAVSSGAGMLEGLKKPPDGRPPESQRKIHIKSLSPQVNHTEPLA